MKFHDRYGLELDQGCGLERHWPAHGSHETRTQTGVEQILHLEYLWNRSGKAFNGPGDGGIVFVNLRGRDFLMENIRFAMI